VRPGDALVYEDAAGTVAIAINTGDAAAVLGARPGSEVTVAAAVAARAGGPADDERVGGEP
jgi:S-adenosylmethionine hydrolase